MDIPTYAKEALFPPDTLSILDLLRRPRHSAKNPLKPVDPEFFSHTPSEIDDAESALSLLSIPLPTPESLEETTDLAPDAIESGKVSFLVDGRPMPFWLLRVWEILHSIEKRRQSWLGALKFLKENKIENDEILGNIPWNKRLPSTANHEDVDLLRVYFTDDWLSDLHMELMGRMLEEHVRVSTNENISLLSPLDVQLLIREYRHGEDKYSTSSSLKHIREYGEELSKGTTKSMFTYVCVTCTSTTNSSHKLPSMNDGDTGNHWISLIFGFSENEGFIRFGDSMASRSVPYELKRVFKWWLGHYKTDVKLIENQIECTIQKDDHSCSVLCHNAIEHHFFPLTIPLVQPRKAFALSERVGILGRVLTFLNSKVSISFVNQI